MKRFIASIIGIGLIVGWVLLFMSYLTVQSEFSGWISRISESADAKQMETYLTKAINGMEKLNINTGYDNYIIRTPDTDMGQDYSIMKENLKRLAEVQKYPVGSMDYAKSLDDIRIQLKSQQMDALSAYLINNNIILYFWVWIIQWLTIVALVVLGIIGMMSDDN